MSPVDINEYPYEHECPRCGRAAFYLDRFPRPSDPVTAEGVMTIRGAPKAGDVVVCQHCLEDVDVSAARIRPRTP